jgi:hypothetical protein
MKNRIAILLVISTLLVMTLSACSAVKDVTTVNDLGKNFMNSFESGNPEISWPMMDSALQQQIGDQAAWANYVAPRKFTDWNFTNTSLKGKTAETDGQAVLNEYTYSVLLGFTKENGTWLISTLDIKLKK